MSRCLPRPVTSDTLLAELEGDLPSAGDRQDREEHEIGADQASALLTSDPAALPPPASRLTKSESERRCGRHIEIDEGRDTGPVAVRLTGVIQDSSAACARSTTSTLKCAAARSMRCSARTALASRRSSRSSTASTRPAGAIEVNGVGLDRDSPDAAKRAGIAMIFQEMSLVPTLSVAQNIFLDNEMKGAFGLDR